MDYIQINPDNVAPSAPRPRIRKVAAYLLYRQLISGGGGIVTDDLVLRSNFNDMANLSLTFPSNGSAEFNGTSDYVQTPTPFSNTQHTICAWVYSGDTSTLKTIFDNRDTSNDGVILASFTDESLFYQVNGNNLFSSVFLNTWVFVAATYDGTTQKLYENGSQVGTQSISTSVNVTTNAKIGREAAFASGYFKGNLANVAIWNRALTSDEINSVMWKGYDSLTASEQNGLQAWYALDSVDTFADWYTYAQNQGAVIEGRTCVDNALNALAQL